MTTAQVKKHNIAGVKARNGLTVYCNQKILCLNTASWIIELFQCYMKCWLLSCTSKQLLNLWNISAIWLNYLHVLSKLKWLGSWYRPYQKSSTRYTWRLLAPQLQDRAVVPKHSHTILCFASIRVISFFRWESTACISEPTVYFRTNAFRFC